MESSWRDTKHAFSGAVAVTPIRNPQRSDRSQPPGGERPVSRVMKVQRLYRDSGHSMRLFVPQAMTTLVADDHGRWIKAELAAHRLSGSTLVL